MMRIEKTTLLLSLCLIFTLHSSCVSQRGVFYSLKKATRNAAKVIVLDLSNETIDIRLEDYDFSIFSKLKELNLSNNKLDYLPETITKLEGLEVLKLNNVGFDSFPDSLYKLYNLRAIWLMHNKIGALPLDQCQFDKLELLVIIDTMISSTEVDILKEKLPKGCVVIDNVQFLERLSVP
jgi:Leucine-rich repeat (LRR) protein